MREQPGKYPLIHLLETTMNYTLKRGLNVPVVTVLDEMGRVIENEQRRVIQHVLQVDDRRSYGANVIFGVGTTGEWNRISNPERQRSMQIEIDEVRRINETLSGQDPVEIWVGVNGKTKAEILANLDAAIELGADAAVIAPLAVEDLPERDIVHFFQRDLTRLLETSRRELPVFLYDNADIAATGNAPHIRTQIVKQLSRLPWIYGIKVSASRSVLGNYTKAALHYKLPGEFGIYIGNAMLIFDIYRPSHDFIGRLREGWRDYLLRHSPPLGVISGPGNVMPREWQKAWRAVWSGDEEQIDQFQSICQDFEEICEFEENGRRVVKMLACLKYALETDGVISSSLVGPGTPALTIDQRKSFEEKYAQLRDRVRREIDQPWQTTRIATSRFQSIEYSMRG
jgi:dihydrodipicolinate synthase/N-acetylneuraminate lyase